MENTVDAPSEEAVQDSEAQAPQYVTTEQLNQFSEKLSGDMKAMLGRVPHMVNETVQNSVPKQQAEEAPKGSKNFDPKAEVSRILKEEREGLAKEKQAIQRQRIRGSLEQELVNNGANPAAVKLAADSLMMRNSDKISIDSNEMGESKVVFKDSEYSEGVGIGDFVRDFLTSAEGAAVVQPKKSPSVRGIPNGGSKIVGEVIKMTRQEASTADPKILMSGRAQFTD